MEEIEVSKLFSKLKERERNCKLYFEEYLKKAEERLREEEDRVERFLNTHTRKSVCSNTITFWTLSSH